MFVYPVLQAADILLYKAVRVPVGEDNLQNVQVARKLANAFNNRTKSKVFRKPEAELLSEDVGGARIRSLRHPEKKMSKSDPDWRGCIYVTDPPEVVLEKCRKAVTDFDSAITYDPEERPGVSNLVAIHAALTDRMPEQVVAEAQGLDTLQYKLRLADVISEHIEPIRQRTEELERRPEELEDILKEGAAVAREMAKSTMEEVRQAMGFTNWGKSLEHLKADNQLSSQKQ